MKATLKYIENHTLTIKTFWFKPEKAVDNVPGQYTEIYLPHKNPDKRGQKRWFTIYSSPTENLLAITTKITNQCSSFKKALNELKIGAEIIFSEPMGDFILPIDDSLPLVFVAGGIGMTPFRSIIKWLEDSNQKRDIQLIYAAKNESDLIDRDLFAYVNTKYIISEPSSNWKGLSGKLSANKILKLSKIKPSTHIFLSGPEPMVEAFTKDIISTGLPKHQIITDYFPGYVDL